MNTSAANNGVTGGNTSQAFDQVGTLLIKKIRYVQKRKQKDKQAKKW